MSNKQRDQSPPPPRTPDTNLAFPGPPPKSDEQAPADHVGADGGRQVTGTVDLGAAGEAQRKLAESATRGPKTRREPTRDEDADPDSERATGRYDRRPSAEDFESLARDLRPKEMEHLISILSKQLGREGKTPTGRHVAKHGFMRDAREHEEKPQRVAPGTVLDDLSEAEIAHLTKHKAIEPEYA